VIEFKDGTPCTSLARKLHELRDLLKAIPEAKVEIPEVSPVSEYDCDQVSIFLNVTLLSGNAMVYENAYRDLTWVTGREGAMEVIEGILDHVENLVDAGHLHNRHIPTDEILSTTIWKVEDSFENIIPQFTFNIYLPESIYYY
jgi:hypothetical protein